MPDEPVERFPEGPSDDDIASRLRRVRDELSEMEGLPELPDEKIPEIGALPPAPDFDAKLRDLEARAQAAKDRREVKASTERKQLARSAEDARGLGMGMAVAYTIIGLPIAGIGIGWLIDQSQGTTIFRGFGAVIGSILGIVGAMLMLNRNQNRRP